jgi:hypothetical protein
MWDRDYWRKRWKTAWSPDYLRWRTRRRWVSLGLLFLTLILLSPIIFIYQHFNVRSAWGLVFVGFCVFVLFAIYRLLGWTGQRYRPPVDEDYPAGDGSDEAIILDAESQRSRHEPRPSTRPSADRSGCRPWMIVIGVLSLICVLACGGVVAVLTWKAWHRIHQRPPPPSFRAMDTDLLKQPYYAFSVAIWSTG